MCLAQLKVEHLSFGYGPNLVLRDISFSVEGGRFCALLGPNGAGKSTLFSLLTGIVSVRTGQIEVSGINLSASPRAALAKMGIVFQQMTLDLDLSVRRNLFYYAALRGMSGREASQRIEASLDLLGVLDKSSVRVRELNGGHRRRVEIARSLIHKPKILLLDEPTVGLDPASRKAITDHVHSLCERTGLTVLWATHLVDEVQPQDELIILHKGQVLVQDVAHNIMREKSLERVFLDMTLEKE